MPSNLPTRVLFEQLAQNAQPPNWIVDQLFVAGGVYLLAGQAKKGKKSMISMALSVAIASGLPFLGRKTVARPLIFCAMEDGYQQVGWRAKQMGFDVPTWREGFLQCAIGAVGAIEVVQLVQNGLRDTVVIIDPLVDYMGLFPELDENSAADVTKLLRSFQELARASNCTFIFVHHFNKSRETMRGSTALEAACEGYGESFPTQDDTIVKLVWTLRNGKGITTYVQVEADDRERLTVKEVDGSLVEKIDQATMEGFIMEYMLGAPLGYPISKATILDDLKASWSRTRGKMPGRDRVYDAIGRLVASGKLARLKKGFIVEPTYREGLEAQGRGGWN